MRCLFSVTLWRDFYLWLDYDILAITVRYRFNSHLFINPRMAGVNLPFSRTSPIHPRINLSHASEFLPNLPTAFKIRLWQKRDRRKCVEKGFVTATVHWWTHKRRAENKCQSLTSAQIRCIEGVISGSGKLNGSCWAWLGGALAWNVSKQPAF